MEITHRGTISDIKRWYGKCGVCGTTAIAPRNELTNLVAMPGTDIVAVEVCPVCKSNGVVTPGTMVFHQKPDTDRQGPRGKSVNAAMCVAVVLWLGVIIHLALFVAKHG